MNEVPARHGGDLTFATERYGMPKDGWLDLSTGINPHPYPSPAITADQLTRLPGRGALDALIAIARKSYQVPTDVGLIAVPGTEIAIRLIPMLAPDDASVAILAPTYASHADAWRNAARPVVEVAALDLIPANTTVTVIGNPNNPDGRTCDPASLVRLAHRLDAAGGFLVVDEAFADLEPEVSLAPHLAGVPALIVRSFGKFYGLAGVRLGFVAGPPALTNRLAALFGDWPVSAPAIAIGGAALTDQTWRDETRLRLKRDAARLRNLLGRHRLTVIGATDLFTLIAADDAPALHRRLAEQGIWTRAFADRPTWLRFGLPPDDGFARLDRALATAAN